MQLTDMFILDPTLENYFVDKSTGAPLAGGFIYFYEDDNRNVLKPVYQLSGSPPNYTVAEMPNPITLSSVGTIQDSEGNNVAIYFYPYDSFGNLQNYYIVVQDANGDNQFTRENWPGIMSGETPEAQSNSFSNMLSNPQFAFVNFNPAFGLTIPYTSAYSSTPLSVEIAPNWFLNINATGNGSITINQVAVSGSSLYPTNPPYVLQLSPGSNISALSLSQTLYNNPDIWSQTSVDPGWISGSLTISNNAEFTMSYVPNIPGGAGQTIVTGNNISGVFQTFTGTAQLELASNTDAPPAGYTQIVINLPITGSYSITSAQVVALNGDISPVAYEQTPVNRQFDQLSHYYIPQCQFKRIPSYLTGWDFPLNPAQWGSTYNATTLGANKSDYVWDQTIVFSSVTGGFSATSAGDGALQITGATSTPTSLALVQYIPTTQALELLNGDMSVNISAFTGVTGGLNGCVTLWYTDSANLPNVASGTNNSIVATLDTTGFPTTQNGTWTQVPRSNLGNAQFTIAKSATSTYSDVQLNGWALNNPSAANAATYVAIVVGLAPLAHNAVVTFNSISLNQGKQPTRPGAQSPQAVLADCRYYYEKSYDLTDLPGTTTTSNQLLIAQSSYNNGTTNFFFQNAGFGINYKNTKIYDNPNIAFYSPIAGTSGSITAWVYDPGTPVVHHADAVVSTYWTNIATTEDSATYTVNGSLNLPTGGGGYLDPSQGAGWITLHYVVDSRLGIIV